jgi:hypothetical protein
MKIINLIILYLIVFAFSSCLKNSNINEKQNPKIDSLADLRFVNSRADFGLVSGDTLLKGKYVFVNTSKHILKIIAITPDCSCTSFSTNKSTINPQDSAYIILQVATKNKSGIVDLYATVSANTPAKLYILKLAANVK